MPKRVPTTQDRFDFNTHFASIGILQTSKVASRKCFELLEVGSLYFDCKWNY